MTVRQALGDPHLVPAPEAAELLGPEWLAWVAPDIEVLRTVRVDTAEAAVAVFEAEWADL